MVRKAFSLVCKGGAVVFVVAILAVQGVADDTGTQQTDTEFSPEMLDAFGRQTTRELMTSLILSVAGDDPIVFDTIKENAGKHHTNDKGAFVFKANYSGGSIFFLSPAPQEDCIIEATRVDGNQEDKQNWALLGCDLSIDSFEITQGYVLPLVNPYEPVADMILSHTPAAEPLDAASMTGWFVDNENRLVERFGDRAGALWNIYQKRDPNAWPIRLFVVRGDDSKMLEFVHTGDLCVFVIRSSGPDDFYARRWQNHVIRLYPKGTDWPSYAIYQDLGCDGRPEALGFGKQGYNISKDTPAVMFEKPYQESLERDFYQLFKAALAADELYWSRQRDPNKAD